MEISYSEKQKQQQQQQHQHIQNDTAPQQVQEKNINTSSRTGLNNYGNNCFLNAAIQCLAVSPFIHMFIENYKEDDIKLLAIINKYKLNSLGMSSIPNAINKLLLDNPDIITPDKTILLYLADHCYDIFIYLYFKNIIQTLHTRNVGIYTCNKLISVAQEATQHNTRYAGFSHLFAGTQNDPHEFMAFLLDKIHNAKTTTVNMETSQTQTQLYAQQSKYVQAYLTHFKLRYKNDYSLFVKNFYYYILSCVICDKCKVESISVNPGDIMCVAIPPLQPQPINFDNAEKVITPITLNECINDMFNIERIEYKCEGCGNTENNIINKKLLTPPKTLIIKLKRYIQHNNMLIKNDTFIQYPQTLDLKSNYCGSTIHTYELYGIINHSGSLNRGHYYSFIKNNTKDYSKTNTNTNTGSSLSLSLINDFQDMWFLCNDSITKQIDIKEVLSSKEAYILFYYSKN